jgi:hypothetical protein
LTTTETVEDIAQMDKGEIALQIFKLMMEKDWSFPYDAELAESQADQWDFAATQRALKLAAMLMEEKL